MASSARSCSVVAQSVRYSSRDKVACCRRRHRRGRVCRSHGGVVSVQLFHCFPVGYGERDRAICHCVPYYNVIVPSGHSLPHHLVLRTKDVVVKARKLLAASVKESQNWTRRVPQTAITLPVERKLIFCARFGEEDEHVFIEAEFEFRSQRLPLWLFGWRSRSCCRDRLAHRSRLAQYPDPNSRPLSSVDGGARAAGRQPRLTFRPNRLNFFFQIGGYGQEEFIHFGVVYDIVLGESIIHSLERAKELNVQMVPFNQIGRRNHCLKSLYKLRS